MSHHHGPVTPGPTCPEFLGTFVGRQVAFIRDRQPKIIGELVHVSTVEEDEHDALLVVSVDGGVRKRVRFSELTRARMHPLLNPKDRR